MSDLPEVLRGSWDIIETTEETTVVIKFGDEIIFPWGDEQEKWRTIGAAIAAVPDLLLICQAVASSPESDDHILNHFLGFVERGTIEKAREILEGIQNLKELDYNGDIE